jgi:hypothetical protein
MYFTLRLDDGKHQAWQASARAKIRDWSILWQKWLQLRALGDVSLVYFGGSFG